MKPTNEEQSGPLLANRTCDQERTPVIYAMLEDSQQSSGVSSLAATRQSDKRQPAPRLLGSRGPDSEVEASTIKAGASNHWQAGAKSLPAGGLQTGDLASSRNETHSQFNESAQNLRPVPSHVVQPASLRNSPDRALSATSPQLSSQLSFASGPVPEITSAPDSIEFVTNANAEVHSVSMSDASVCSAHLDTTYKQETLPVPEYNKSHFHGEDIKFKVTTEHAVQVFMKAQVITIDAVDDMDESFTATFTLHLHWIDPKLKGFKSKVAYYAADGHLWKRNAAVTGYPGYDGAENYTLTADPRLDFSVGDTVEALKEMYTSHARIPQGERGQITRSEKDKVIVRWNTFTMEKPYPFDDIQIVPDVSSNIVDKKGCHPELHIQVPVACWDGMAQPDWKDPCWFQPRWSFINSIESPRTLDEFCELQYTSHLGGHVFTKLKFQGKFANKLKLHSFPFDSQELRIKISAEQPLEQLQWAALDTTAGRKPQIPPQWALEEECNKFVIKSPGEAYRGILQQVYISMKLRRKPEFFLKQVVFVMFCLFFTSFLASLVDPANIAERAAIVLTVLLVTAGYRHMSSQWVPRRSFNTWLDYYTLFAFTLQFAVVVWNFALIYFGCTSVDDADDSADGKYNGTESGYLYRKPPERECWQGDDKADQIFYEVISCIWVSLHLLMVILYLKYLGYQFKPMNQWCKCCEKGSDGGGGSSGLGGGRGSCRQKTKKKHPYGIVDTDSV